ncbi:hypothetical protein CTheo_8507 [Ceratobasidium theobromae]|uniref:Copia protein n=1 Tax=Ceratobasidium theobromae TaxID=1582974 RepID=A0A5N5Q8H5_9AGAM|nr:hypothetical protein CTheo_8507 [Ceratobasidium theobromae]
MKLSMPGYIKKIIVQMGMENCATAHTPASHTTVLMPRTPEEAAPDYPYLSAIGRLLWLALTVRPELAYIVGALARHTQSFTNAHITAIKRVLRYLAGTPEVGIHYKTYENDDMEIRYSDSSYRNKEEGRKSISGYAFMYCGAAVAWSSKSQPVVAASTQEAEYIALTHATKHAMWMRQFLLELGLPTSVPTPILTDNQAALSLATSTGTTVNAKHIDIRYHFIRHAYNEGTIDVSYVQSRDNLADLFTKPLPLPQFVYLADSVLGSHRNPEIDFPPSPTDDSSSYIPEDVDELMDDV